MTTTFRANAEPAQPDRGGLHRPRPVRQRPPARAGRHADVRAGHGRHRGRDGDHAQLGDAQRHARTRRVSRRRTRSATGRAADDVLNQTSPAAPFNAGNRTDEQPRSRRSPAWRPARRTTSSIEADNDQGDGRPRRHRARSGRTARRPPRRWRPTPSAPRRRSSTARSTPRCSSRTGPRRRTSTSTASRTPARAFSTSPRRRADLRWPPRRVAQQRADLRPGPGHGL